MKLRIRLSTPPNPTPRQERQRKLALGAAALLAPASLAAYALGCWRIAADLQWTGEFAIARGIFSHWQVWIVLGALIQAVAISLGRFGRGGGLSNSDATVL